MCELKMYTAVQLYTVASEKEMNTPLMICVDRISIEKYINVFRRTSGSRFAGTDEQMTKNLMDAR